MKERTPQRNYRELRAILEKEIGKEYTDDVSDEEMKLFGDFIIDCTQSCAL